MMRNQRLRNRLRKMPRAESVYSPRWRRGGTLLETAFVLSLLLMLSFGTVEYGYFFYIKNMVASAAREGVRSAIPSTATNTTVTNTVANVMQAASIPSSAYTVTISPSNISSIASGTPIQVTVTCTWNQVGIQPLPVAMGGISPSKQVSGTAIMMRE